MKVYLSVPLVANRRLERANTMARAILDSGNEVSSPWVLDPYRRHDPAELNVFDRDWGGVKASDAVVAEVSSPSTGVGMEVMAAHIARKRVVLAFERGSPVSGMLLHMDGKEVVEFSTDPELYEGLKETLRNGAAPPGSRRNQV